MEQIPNYKNFLGSSAIGDADYSAKSPEELTKYLLIQKRHDVSQVIEKFHDRYFYNNDANRINTLKAAIVNLYFYMEPIVERNLTPEEYKEFNNLILNTKDGIVLINCFRKLNRIMDAIKLTRFDNHAKIDYQDMEALNEQDGV